MSAFSQVHAKFYLDIPVYKMNDLKEGTRRAITNKLLTYDETLKGVILGFKNSTPCSQFAKFYADTPAIHMQMEADFLVFRPIKGTTLPAKVTFVNSTTASLTVLGAFTANADLADLRQNWSFSNSMWRQGPECFGEGDTLEVQLVDYIPTSTGIDFNVKVIKKLSAAATTEEAEEPQAEE